MVVQKVQRKGKRLSFRLIFYEAFILERDAKRREKYFKTTKGKRALRLMLKDREKTLVK